MSDWYSKSNKVLYQNNWMTLREHQVITPAGKDGIYGVVELRNVAVYVIAIDDHERILLINQKRFAIQRDSIEVPAGASEEAETLVAAQRELFEETGYEARTWQKVGSFNSLNGLADAPGEVFLATNLKQVKKDNLQGYEEGITEIRFYPIAEVLNMIVSSKITDAESIVAITKTLLMLNKRIIVAPIRIALTGGIASGKSSASAVFRSLGANIIDHDQIARDVVAKGTLGLREVVQRFGDQVLKADGTLDRGKLAEIVFNDEAALKDLNQILHPLIKSEARDREKQILAGDPGGIVIHDIPLLVESDQVADFQEVILISVPKEVQLERLVTTRGYAISQATARIQSQSSDADRRKIATKIVDGSGTLEQLKEQINVVWQELGGEVDVISQRTATRR